MNSPEGELPGGKDLAHPSSGFAFTARQVEPTLQMKDWQGRPTLQGSPVGSL